MSVPAPKAPALAPARPQAPGSRPAPTGPPGPARAPGSPARIRRKRHHVGFLVLASIVVVPMILGIVSLNVLLAQTSFRIDAVERRIADLSREQVDLVRRQATLSAPGRIADWAARHGMRLPDDIRSLHAPSDPHEAPAGADPSASGGDG